MGSKELQMAGSEAVAALGNSLLSASSQATFLSAFNLASALVLALNAATPGTGTHEQLARLLLQGTGHASASGDQQLQELGGPSGAEAALNQGLAALTSALRADSSSCQDNEQGCGSPKSELLIAASIWTAAKGGVPLKEEYVAAMEQAFGAVARQGAAADINAWVSTATRGLIPKLLEPNTRFDCVLASALYFKGKWQHPFKKDATQPRPFAAPTGERSVPMMQRVFKPPPEEQHPARIARFPGQYTAVRLPYQGGSFSAVAILPEDASASPRALWASLDVAKLLHDSSAWQLPPRGGLQLLLPRFEAKAELSLGNTLEGMGVTDAFSRAARFERLSAVPMYVDDVIHKVVVKVDEEGAEAAAATAVVMMRMCAGLPPERLVFDRPFAFMILHDASGLPLFQGVVDEPSS